MFYFLSFFPLPLGTRAGQWLDESISKFRRGICGVWSGSALFGWFSKMVVDLYCIKIHAPITGEGIAGKKSRMTSRKFCTNVTSVFKTNGRKGHFYHMRETKPLWSDCLVTKIGKRQKIVGKKMNMLREKGVQILNFLRFSFDFTLSSKTSFLIGISWTTFACIAVWRYCHWIESEPDSSYQAWNVNNLKNTFIPQF